MLRRHIQLLTLTLLSFAALGVPRAEAVNFVLIPDTEPFSCAATASPDVDCSKMITFSSPGADLGTDLANEFELKTTVTQGTWDITIQVTDDDGDIATAGFTGVGGINAGNDGVLYRAYNLFTGAPGAIDFDQITKIELLLSNQSAIGDKIEIGQLTAVPEPGTAAMLMLGLVGLAAGSPRRRVAA